MIGTKYERRDEKLLVWLTLERIFSSELLSSMFKIPRSMIPASGNKRILPKPAEKLQKSLEHENSMPDRMSPDFFGRFPPEKRKKLVGIHWKNSEAFHPENCFHVPAISRTSPYSLTWT